jgi:heme exporter protein D
MAEKTPQLPGTPDRIFNAETCRALRRGGRKVGRAIPVFVTYALGAVATFAVGAVSSSPVASVGLTLAMTGVTGATCVAVMWWVNLLPARETLREMKRDLRREARVIAGDSEAIEARKEENSGTTARPELAFGLSPESCFIVFGLPVMVLYPAVTSQSPILWVAGSLALSGVLFVVVKHEETTYPPEDPPHGRD